MEGNNQKLKRVIIFVDGFNLYHAIDDLDKDDRTKRYTHTKHYLKWLNLHSLGQALIHPKNDVLVKVFYFSAYAGWLKQESQARHRTYVDALVSTGVEPVMGTFKKKPRRCPKCHHKWDGHEEKESDVNIATYLVAGALADTYDKAIIFTADTDITPAILEVKKSCPLKEILVAIPEKRLNRSNALTNAAHNKIRLKEVNFQKNLFPESFTCERTGKTISCPEKYKPIVPTSPTK